MEQTCGRLAKRKRARAAAQVALTLLGLSCGAYDSGLLQSTPASQPAAAGSPEVNRGARPPAGGAAGTFAPSKPANSGVARASTCGDGEVGTGERCDTAIPNGSRGACPDSCEPMDTLCVAEVALRGEGCQRHCAVSLITEARSGDGCCPGTADAASDSDCSMCGDAMITGAEACDPPERCPNAETCRSEGCYVAVLTGDPQSCSSRCSRTPIVECEAGDGCCPPGCTHALDDDCTQRCGDGVIEENSGETCEPMSTVAPCVTECDDGDACTSDRLTGSGGNCNAACVHFPVTTPESGDGCCPKGASANNDPDCTPVCGNAVREADEECDGGDLCTSDCRAISMQERQCLDNVTIDAPGAGCEQCVCSQCAEQALDCYDTDDEARDRRCAALVTCARRDGCSGDDCYCGSSPGCIAPNGACREAVEDAAESGSSRVVDERKNDRRYAVVRARTYGECERGPCRDACLRSRE